MPSMTSASVLEALANHVWQSTLFAAAAAMVVLVLAQTHARVRHAVWLAVSVKFLVPYAALVALGSLWPWQAPMIVASPELASYVESVAQPFSSALPPRSTAAAEPDAASTESDVVIATVPVAIWVIGIGFLAGRSIRRWRRLSRALRGATPLTSGPIVETVRRLERDFAITHPTRIVASVDGGEPGVFGCWRPVLLWPRGLEERVNPSQIDTVLTHEISHVSRRDNLSALLHMVVETVFWFHPLVWWIGARLVAERERACDEQVIDRGHDPRVYADGLLTTCRYLLEVPMACVSGVTGADLRQRIAAILDARPPHRLPRWAAGGLTASALAALIAPVAIGALHARPHAFVRPATDRQPLRFEQVSITRSPSEAVRVEMRVQPGGHFTAGNVSLRMLVQEAYGLQRFQVNGGPAWLDTLRFDVDARAHGEVAASPFGEGPVRTMLRALLAEHFRLVAHATTEERDAYALTRVSETDAPGPKLRSSTADCAPRAERRDAVQVRMPLTPGGDVQCGIRLGPGTLKGNGIGMAVLARTLSTLTGQLVADRTGLTGVFDFQLAWTPSAGAVTTLPEPSLPVRIGQVNAIALASALREQFGLALQPETRAIEMLIVDAAHEPALSSATQPRHDLQRRTR